MREKLINIISRCNDKAIKNKWILELIHETDIECMESECTDCLIVEDCMTICDCITDCKIDDNERCGGCKHV